MATNSRYVFDYDRQGRQYASHRRTDPHIAAYALDALGPAATVLNVGAGSGSNEPTDRYVLSLKPFTIVKTCHRTCLLLACLIEGLQPNTFPLTPKIDLFTPFLAGADNLYG